MDVGGPIDVGPFLIGAGALALSGAIGVLNILVWWWQPERVARRALARASEKRLLAIADGDCVRVRGFARRLQAALTAPFSGRACIGYRFLVEEEAEGQWHLLLELEDCAPFGLASDGAVARVEGPFVFGLEIDARGDHQAFVSEALRTTLKRRGVDLTDGWGRPRRLRFSEALLEQDDPVIVLAPSSLTVDPHGQRESFRGPPLLRVIRGTSREPTVLGDDRPAAPIAKA